MVETVSLIDDEEQRDVFEQTLIDTKKAEKPVNEYSDILDEFNSNDESQLRSSMFSASQKDPDTHSQTVKTAKAAKMIPAAVEQDPDLAQSRAKFQQHDYNTLLEDYESTSRVLSNPDSAAIVQDDVGTFQVLEDIWKATIEGDFEGAAVKGAAALFLGGKETINFAEEKLLRAPAAGAIKTFASVPSTLGFLWDRGSFRSAQLLDLVTPDEADKFLYIQEDTPEWLKAFSKASEFISPGQVGKGSGAAIRQFADVVDVPRERSDWMTDITGAMGQISAMVLTAGIAGPAASTTLMFSQGADMQRQAMEAEGVQPTIPNVLLGGAITAVTERWGIDKLFNRLPAPVKNKFFGLLGDVAKAGTIEMFEEFVEGVAHNTLEFLTFNEDVDFTEGLFEEMRAAGGAAATFRLIIQTMLPGRNRLNLVDYTGEQTKIDNIIKASEESISRDREPSIIRQHVENLIDTHGHSENIYIPAQEVEGVFEELSLNQEIPQIKAVLDQIPEALRLNGDIVIPSQDFVAYFTDSDTIGKIRQHLRLSPDSLTPSEAETIKAQGSEDLKKTIENALRLEKIKNETDKVTDKIADQLIETGRMSSRNARLNAKMLSAYVSTKADRENREVVEVFESLGLKIKSGKVIIPDATVSGLAFNQDLGDVVFKDQKILSTTGKKVNIEQAGQRVWDRNIKRRKQAVKVRECINGA